MTDHPAALVSVPVEPTREMWAAGGTAACQAANQHHDRVVEGVWSAMLAAAPAAPQAAGVGEDVRKAIARIIFPESERVKMDREWGGNRNHSRNRWTKALEQADQIIALRAPSRDPEGRAVWTGSADYEPTDAMIDAGEYHNHRHNPLTNMVASFKAMMAQAEIDGLISSTSALATREEAPAPLPELAPYTEDLKGIKSFMASEEAPAEAGEGLDQAVTEAAVSTIRWALDRGDNLRDYKEPLAHVLEAALRAQPQAREDVQAAMTVTLVDVGPGMAIRKWDNHGLSEGTHALYIRPAHDALRKALSRAVHSYDGIPPRHRPAWLPEALAALQAEQGAK